MLRPPASWGSPSYPFLFSSASSLASSPFPAFHSSSSHLFLDPCWVSESCPRPRLRWRGMNTQITRARADQQEQEAATQRTETQGVPGTIQGRTGIIRTNWEIQRGASSLVHPVTLALARMLALPPIAVFTIPLRWSMFTMPDTEIQGRHRHCPPHIISFLMHPTERRFTGVA